MVACLIERPGSLGLDMLHVSPGPDNKLDEPERSRPPPHVWHAIKCGLLQWLVVCMHLADAAT
jgi:hypothetical protein